MGKRVWQYPEATGITNDDVILLDSPTGGSRSIKANEIGSVLINKTLTERGTFDAADDNVDGYKKVTVDVPYTDVEVASGPIASWDDGEDLPLKSLTSFIEPQQDLHGYDTPWVGGSGKNKCDTHGYGGISYNGGVGTAVTFTDSTTTVTVNKNIISYSVTSWGGVVFKTASLPSGTYHFHAEFSSTANRKTFYVLNSNNVVIEKANYSDSGGTLNNLRTLEDGDCIAIWIGSNNAVDITITNMQVEGGNSYTTFAPYSNICPISGFTEANVTVVGKNMLHVPNGEITTQTGTKFTETTDGIAVSGTLPSNSTNVILLNQVLPSGTYTFSAMTGSSNTTYQIVYKIGTNTSKYVTTVDKSFTLEEDTNVNVLLYLYSGATTPVTIKAQLELGEVSSTYSQYNGQTYTIDLGGTRYGGTLDVVSGVLTVDRVSITVDENSSIVSGSYGLPFRIDLLTGAKASSSASALTGVKCNFLTEVTQDSSWGVNGTFSRVTVDPKVVYFKVNSEITTVQQLKTFLQSNNLQFVYELATPQTIQLTPTQVKSLVGQNNIYSDTGDVDVEYQKIWVRPSA